MSLKQQQIIHINDYAIQLNAGKKMTYSKETASIHIDADHYTKTNYENIYAVCTLGVTV